MKVFYKIIHFPDESLTNYLISKDIDWKFIPPKSPDFWGHWEADVKHDVKWVMDDLRLIYEELETIVIQVETILNSQNHPNPLSNNFYEFEILTPGHFFLSLEQSMLYSNFR